MRARSSRCCRRSRSPTRPDLDQDVETILAGNIFHRAVVFGPRVAANEPGAGRVLVNGEVEHVMAPGETGAHLEEMIETVRDSLAAVDEDMLPGQRIITGVLAPPHAAQPGDRVRLELDALGGVELLGVGAQPARPAAQRSLFRGMTTALPALPDALSDAARAFAAGPHCLIVGGERLEAADGRTFETLDPATGRPIAEVPHAGAADVDRAVGAAREAFEDGRWSGIAAAKARARCWRSPRPSSGTRTSSPSWSRSTTASRPPPGAWTCRSRSSTCVPPAGRPRSPATFSWWLRPTCTATRARSRSACAGRSSRGTSRC